MKFENTLGKDNEYVVKTIVACLDKVCSNEELSAQHLMYNKIVILMCNFLNHFFVTNLFNRASLKNKNIGLATKSMQK